MPTFAAPLLLPGEVHVWRAAISALMPSDADFEALLSDDERQRAGRFFFETDKDQFVLGRSALRGILGPYLKLKPAAIRFEYGPHGKPLVCPSQNGAGIHFNLSHSGDWLVCALTRDSAVGIDIERRRSDVDFDGIAARIFSEHDSRRFNRLPLQAREQTLFDAWTHKEAMVKALGVGLSFPFSAIEGSLRCDGRPSAGWMQLTHEGRPWCARSLDVAQGYSAALVVESPTPRLRHFDWDSPAQLSMHTLLR